MITVTSARGTTPDFVGLRKSLAQHVAGATLDDHRGWVEQMRTMTHTAVFIGVGLLGLVMVAATLLIAVATRGAMSTNRAVVEVLHFVGAKNQYIAGQFQRHFLALGLKGAGIGCGTAAALFAAGAYLIPRWGQLANAEQVTALFGSLALGLHGYAGILGLMITMATVVALTSRVVVNRTLQALD
jgi:cell division transport system permease protein